MANGSTDERPQGRDPTYFLSSVTTLFGVLITGLFVFMTFRIDSGARSEARKVAEKAVTEAQQTAERTAREEARTIAEEEARAIAQITGEEARTIAIEEVERRWRAGAR